MAAIVVVLSREPDLAGQELGAFADSSLKCIRVTTAYEAAAEILAAPTAAMVVDLRCLNLRHIRLLQIARELDVEILAVGSLPAGLSAEQLSGVKLVAMRSLTGEISKIYNASPVPQAKLPPAEAPVPAEPKVVLAPAKQPATSKPVETIECVLSPDEIAALLGGQS